MGSDLMQPRLGVYGAIRSENNYNDDGILVVKLDYAYGPFGMESQKRYHNGFFVAPDFYNYLNIYLIFYAAAFPWTVCFMQFQPN